jgi:arabinofuranan 3-O-arabinosyltransferase
MDGFDTTEWAADPTETDAWWKVDLEGPIRVGSVGVTLGRAAPSRFAVVVETANGASRRVVLRPGVRRVITVPRGQSDWVRIRASGEQGAMALAEVSVPGVTARRQLVVPDVPEQWGSPDLVLLRALLDARTGCAEVSERTPCLEDRFRPSEEPFGFERSVSLPVPRTYPMELTARPVAGDDLYRMLQEDLPLNATASSVAVPDARASALAAVDGDPGTSWTPRLDDDQPELALSWLGRRPIRGLVVGVGKDAPVRRPTRLLLTWPGGEREVQPSVTGRVSFDPITTDRLGVRVLDAENAASVDAAGVGSALPPGIGELRLEGLPFDQLRFPDDEVEWACGTGPTVVVDGVSRDTRLRASREALYHMESVTARLCGEDQSLRLGSDGTVNAARASPVATAAPLTLGEVDESTEASGLAVDSSTSVRKRVGVGDADYLVLRQNTNPGWSAEQAGEVLEPVVVDGWQQAWRIGDSDSDVVAVFEPDSSYRLGLGVGAALFVLLLGLAVLPGIRWPGERLPALRARRLPAVLMMTAAVLGGGFLAGLVGAGCALAGVVLGWLARRRASEVTAWLAGSLALAASAAYFLRPWGDPSGWAGELAWPHYLVVVAVGAVLGAATEPGPRRLRAMKGRSTRRKRTSAATSDRASVSR